MSISIVAPRRSVEHRDLLRDLPAAGTRPTGQPEGMPRILLVYASTHGHTAKIAARIAAALEHDGATVDLQKLHANESEPAPRDYDAVILGASIHAGHHQHALVKWAKGHHVALGAIPSAFFSVCLTAADDTEESRVATQAYVDDFVEQTGWTPGRCATFAGALQYREYDFATRLLVRLLMSRTGRPTDPSQDYDYTDWDAVERWAHELTATLTAAVAPA
jgi:menaquinone-dependent protoporphyrinogen oxidase